MRSELQQRVALFVKNRDRIKSEYHWESAYMYPLCANIWTSRDRLADLDKMKEALALLKEKTGVFSNFRGTAKMMIVTMLSMSDSMELSMNQLLTLYEELRSTFGRSEFMVIIADIMAELLEPEQYDEMIQRTRILYDAMKKEHPFLTSKEDATFAALLAMNNRENNELLEDMKQSYRILKNVFSSGNAIQALSHILALSDAEVSLKCQRVVQLYDRLKANGHTYGKNYELATLGVFALLDGDLEILVKEIGEVDDVLKNVKGFGFFGIGAKQRLMYAAMLVSMDYTATIVTFQTAAMNGVLSIILAQQAAMCASIAAASAASSASNSSS